jgi:hypothetical protein
MPKNAEASKMASLAALAANRKAATEKAAEAVLAEATAGDDSETLSSSDDGDGEQASGSAAAGEAPNGALKRTKPARVVVSAGQSVADAAQAQVCCVLW